MNNFLQRTLTGAFYVAFLVLGTISEIAFPIVFPALMVMVLYEFYRITLGQKEIAKWLPGILLSLLMFAMVYLKVEQVQLAFPIFLIMSVSSGIYLVYQLFAGQKFLSKEVPIVVFGISYLGLPFILLPFLSAYGAERWEWLLSMLVVIWLYDSFAYIFGVSFGKHRLYKKISPKKSWEGAIGGLATTLLASYLAHALGWMNDYSLLEILVLTLIIIIAATLGDLTESMLKRNKGVKDSGNLLPGHGGFFDRLDSFILAVPVLLLTLYLSTLI